MQYRRKILVINRKFQLKFIVFVCSWVAILSLALPLGLKAGLDAFLERISQSISAESVEQIKNFHADVFQVYGVTLAIALALIFWLCLLLSHRIAGPVFRVQSALERWKRGNVEHQLRLRKGDQFHELAKAYNEAAQEYIQLRNQVRHATDALTELSKDLELKHRTQMQEIIGGIQWNPESHSSQS